MRIQQPRRPFTQSEGVVYPLEIAIHPPLRVIHQPLRASLFAPLRVFCQPLRASPFIPGDEASLSLQPSLGSGSFRLRNFGLCAGSTAGSFPLVEV